MTLIDIVRNIAERLLSERETNSQQPVVTYVEITHELNEAALECMRELIRRGEYTGGVNVNKVPMLLKKTNNSSN